MIVLVAEAQPARLRELILALLDLDAGLRVCVEAPALLDVPAGATVLLRLRAEDSTWLNYTRPIFSDRAWRVVLWDEDGATTAIKEKAPDFFDWISHVVTCPAGVPGFAVRGLQAAPRFPGVVWHGRDLEGTLAVAYPDEVSTALSARAPYAELVAAAREAPGWLVCRDMASARDLVRLRWALAETGRMARCVLIEPKVNAPGWWPVSDKFSSWEEMLQEIGGDDPGAAALVAALLEREPDTGKLAKVLQRDGAGLAELAKELRGLDDPGAMLTPLVDLRGLLAHAVIQRRVARPVLRALEHDSVVDDARAQHAAKVTVALASWRADSGQLDWSLKEADLWAWAGTAPEDVPALPTERPPHWSSVYWLEATLGREQPSPAAVAWARELEFVDVVAYWENAYGRSPDKSVAQRQRDELASVISDTWAQSLVETALREDGRKREQARRLVDLADLLSRRGQHQRAERMLRRALSVLEESLGAEHPDVAVVLDGMASVLRAQGRYDEAEILLHRALAIDEQAGVLKRPPDGDDLHSSDLQQSWDKSMMSLQHERAHALLHAWRLFAARNELGDMELVVGNLDAARTRYGEGLKLAKTLADREPHNPEAQRDLLASELRLARLEIRAQQPDEARHHLGAARSVLERIDAAGSLHDDALLEKYRQSIIELERALLP